MPRSAAFTYLLKQLFVMPFEFTALNNILCVLIASGLTPATFSQARFAHACRGSETDRATRPQNEMANKRFAFIDMFDYPIACFSWQCAKDSLDRPVVRFRATVDYAPARTRLRNET